MKHSDRRFRRTLLPVTTIALAIALSGCTAPADPEPTATSTDALFTAEDGVRASANLFFSLLAAADVDPDAVQIEPAVDLDPENPLALLLTADVYAQIEDRPKILSLGDVTVSEDEESATATVTYELAGTEHTDAFDLRFVAQPETGARDYAIVLPADEFGLDATGVELLPADTEYRIHGIDVSATFQSARDAEGTTPRVPAFGGTYPLEITVPGADGFTETLELQTSTFYGGDGTDGLLAEFARAHGF